MNPLLEKDLALLRETQAHGRAGCLFPLSCMSKSEKRRGLKLRKAGYLEKGYTPATKQGYTLTVQGFEALLEDR